MDSFSRHLILLLLAFGCTTVKYTYEYGAPRKVQITASDVLLITWLPSENTQLYLEKIYANFIKKGIQAKYIVAEEWDLLNAGVEFPIDPGDFHILRNLGYTHVLHMRNRGSKSAPVITYFTSLEVSQENNIDTYNPTWEHLGNQASMHIMLIDLEDHHNEYAVTVSANIGGMRFDQRDGGEFQVNLSDTEMAASRSIHKGIKRLLRDCYQEQ